jgi:sugar lactone lactonase YvrE
MLRTATLLALLGALGHPFIKTPHMDCIGQEGARFSAVSHRLVAFPRLPHKKPKAALRLSAKRAEWEQLLQATNAEKPFGIVTIAGNGAEGVSGDGGPALQATFTSPTQVAVDRRGNLYIADYGNSRIRKIDGHGVITTFAGTGAAGFAGDGGLAIQAKINFPHALTVTANGTVYFTDTKNHRVRQITPTGIITTIAGNGQAGFAGDGGPALQASLNQPEGIAVDARGNLFIAEFNNHIVRKISPEGKITTVAGIGKAGSSNDGGPAINAALNITPAVAVDAAGNLYVCDRENHRVRKVDRRGLITTVAGNGVEAATANIGDGGSATAASLNRPVGLALDRAGNLYIAERNGHRVRKVTPAGIITTIAGTGVAGFNGDHADATNAMLHTPRRLTINQSGRTGDVLYIADTGNHRIRRVKLK